MNTLTLPAVNKPTIDQQIAYLRNERKLMERSRIILEDEQKIKEFDIEISLMREIEENLITVKRLSESRQPDNTCTGCGTPSDQLTKEWVQEGRQMLEPGERLCQKCLVTVGLAITKDTFTWPRRGASVMVLVNEGSKSEWVDSYVTEHLDMGVRVTTYYGSQMDITDPAHIQTQTKEVSHG